MTFKLKLCELLNQGNNYFEGKDVMLKLKNLLYPKLNDKILNMESLLFTINNCENKVNFDINILKQDYDKFLVDNFNLNIE